MSLRFSALCAAAAALLLAPPARSELVVDIGGPAWGDSIAIQPGGQLLVDVWISSTTGTERLVDFLPLFDLSSTRLDLNTLNNFLEFAPLGQQPSDFVSSANYVFAGDSEGLIQNTFPTGNYPTRPGALVGLELADASAEYITTQLTGGTVISQPYLIGQFLLVHDLNGLDPSQVEGEEFVIDLPPTLEPEFEGPFFGPGIVPLAFTSNALTISVTAVPEPRAIALGGFVAIAFATRVYRRRAVRQG